MGILWVFVGSFDPFGWYDTAFARAFWGVNTLPEDARKAFRFILGPFGATSTGYFVLQYLIVHHLFPKNEIWGYHAVSTAFLLWFFIDTTF